MPYKTKKEQTVILRLKRKLSSLGLGWESSLDFSWGYITALSLAGLISKKFANEMLDNFANEKFDDDMDKINTKYGRLL